MKPPQTRLFVSPQGNLFMTEIAALVRAALCDLGSETELVGDELPDVRPGWVNLVVAPHEFFPLFPGVSDAQCLEAASCSVMLSVEQPGTPWFGLGNEYSRVAAAVFDINELAVLELRNAGIEAHWLRLGYHPSWDRWGGDPRAARVNDVLYLGSLTDRREKILCDLAPTLAELDCRLVVHDGWRPVTASAANFLWGDAKHDLLARSRILLNLHRSELPYFEWHRHLGAFANGCLVLSEPSESFEPLAPWEHFAVAPTNELGEFITMLLATPELRRRLATSAYEFIRRELTMVDLLRPLLPILEQSVASTARVSRGSRQRLRSAAATARHEPHPADFDAAHPYSLPERSPVERALKHALVNQAKLARELERLNHRIVAGTDQHLETVETPVFAETRPDVSVIVPVHDYGQYVEAALVSALRSRDVALELIVVDDHSSDGSRAVVERVLQCTPHAAIRFISLGVNVGVSAARNLALEQARAPLVFFLDADNRVYPRTLRRLAAALDADPGAAFSYSMLASFGDEQRILSYYPWDLDRLLRGNYIDVMAMVRRTALEAAGGFRVDLQELGWEDYALWLQIAALGGRGVLVPEILGGYRWHGAQRTSIVNIDLAGLFLELRARYPSLPWPGGLTGRDKAEAGRRA